MKFTLRSILSLLFAGAVSLSAEAGVAVPRPVTVTQPDGTTMTLRLVGDEHGHYYLDEQNRMLLPNGDGTYRVLGDAERQDFMAHADAKRAEFNQWVMQRNVRFNRGELTPPIYTESPAARAKMHVDGPVKYEGQNRGLVILVNFADKKMRYSHQDIVDLCGKKGYDRYGAIGSLNEYFYDQSYGKFDFEFDVVGPVTVSHNYAYYGENDATYNQDRRVGELILEAITLADQEHNVDYTKYDWDGDGRVDQIYVIYAGHSESYDGNDPNLIWPHASGILRPDGTYFKFDGVEVNSYACSGEIGGFQMLGDDFLAGIGTMAHEFSHCFGLPDTYNTNDGGGVSAMLYYDVLAGGAHSGTSKYQGTVPCGYTAYERWMCGWLDLIDLDEPTRVEGMPNLGDEPVAYRIVNKGHPDEYYLLENRNNKRWFSYYFDQPGVDGLLITHIDFDRDLWWNNKVNADNSAPRISIVKALNYGNYENAVFGSTEAHDFTGISHNSGTGMLYHNNEYGNRILDAQVTDIQLAADGTISFNFDRLTHHLQIGAEDWIEVEKLDYALKASKRAKVRQSLDFVATNTSEKPLYDRVSSYFAPIPLGDINGFEPTMIYRGHGYDLDDNPYTWIMRVGELDGETIVVDPLPLSANGTSLIQSSHAFMPCTINGDKIVCSPNDFERGGTTNNTWSTTVGTVNGATASGLVLVADEDGVIRADFDRNVAYLKTSKVYGRTTVTRPLELKEVTYSPLCVPTTATNFAEYKVGTEVIMQIPSGETMTTTLSFVPQSKGLFSIEVRSMTGHVLADTILALGVDLPSGIQGIEVDNVPAGSTVKRLLPGGRIVIEKDGQSYELNGRMVTK